jgi:hypothetical protein
MDAAEFARELQQRFELEESATPQADELAALFRLTFRPSARAKILLNILHKYLLKQTVKHARSETSFYSTEAYKGWLKTAPEEPPNLGCWPIIKRQDLIEFRDDFIARGVNFESVCHTSGSTGPSLSIYKSSQELAFLWYYYRHLIQPDFERVQSLPLVLSFPNLYHGSPIRLPSFGKVFVSGVTDSMLIQDALKVLQKTYDVPGHDPKISVITGLSFHVKFFTNFLLEQGYDPREFGIRSLNIVGEYVSNFSRRFLAETWGATVFERFTLTESVGGANRCLGCGHLHLDPHIIGEVTDVDTGETLDEGVGHLVLTQLYPFVQMQPLIRYYTGDLVRSMRSDCSNTLTFDFLGKTSNCVFGEHEGRTEWLLYSVDLHEAIYELPDIRLYDTWPNVRVVQDTTVSSPHIFTQRILPDSNPFTIELTFELRYSPHFFTARVAELRSQILSALRSAQTALSRRLDDGSVALDIRFVGPGTLNDAHKIKI